MADEKGHHCPAAEEGFPISFAFQTWVSTPVCSLLQVNLSGYEGHHCPTDEEGFLQFAKDLPSPVIYEALVHAKPVSPISAYRKTGNFRRLFEKAPPPNGLCVIGDANCYFNPINVRPFLPVFGFCPSCCLWVACYS